MIHSLIKSKKKQFRPTKALNSFAFYKNPVLFKIVIKVLKVIFVLREVRFQPHLTLMTEVKEKINCSKKVLQRTVIIIVINKLINIRHSNHLVSKFPIKIKIIVPNIKKKKRKKLSFVRYVIINYS